MIPSYFLICKKLENIGDNIKNLANYYYTNNIKISNEKEILEIISEEINRTIKHLIKNFSEIFKELSDNDMKKIKKNIFKIKDKIISDYLRDMWRYVKDIEEEMIMIDFYNKLIKEDVI